MLGCNRLLTSTQFQVGKIARSSQATQRSVGTLGRAYAMANRKREHTDRARTRTVARRFRGYQKTHR